MTPLRNCGTYSRAFKEDPVINGESIERMAVKRTGLIKWIVYILARSVIGGISCISVNGTYRLGQWVGRLTYLTMKKRRAIVRKNLKVVKKWMDAHERPFEVDDAMIKEVFIKAGANIVSGFSFSRLSAEQMEAHIQIEGIDHLKTALTEGKGVVLLLAHMGPWEVLNALSGLMKRHGVDAPLGAIYRPLNNAYIDQWVKEGREKTGSHLFNRKDGFFQPAAFIKNGGVLGILADQRAGRGVLVPFFGQDTKTTPMPGLLQKRTHAPMVSLGVETIGRARWRLTIMPVDLASIDPSSADIREAYATICNQSLEKIMSRSISDVFWFHNRFR